MNVDIVGIQSVCSYIQQTKLSKFVIFRQGYGKGAIPIFENLQSESHSLCSRIFSDWANNILSGNANTSQGYEMILFDELESVNESEGAETSGDYRAQRTKKKTNKVRFTFSLMPNENFGRQPNYGGNNMSREDVGKMLSDAIEKLSAKQREDELMKRLAGIEARLNDEDEEEDEEDTDIFDKIERVVDKIKDSDKKKKKKEKVREIEAVNGFEDEDEDEEEEEEDAILGSDEDEPASASVKTKRNKEEVKANLKKAIGILYKYDTDLDRDLLKLAKIAQNNRPMFNTLLESLRKVKV